jgi:hypothetical protein
MERLAARRPNRPESRERKAKPNRAGRFLAITLGSGVLAALLAVVIAAASTVVSAVSTPPQAPQITASSLFPPVPPLHRTVDVYDPAPQAPPKPRSTPSPSPVRATPSASPTRPPDD